LLRGRKNAPPFAHLRTSNRARFKRYEALAAKTSDVTFVGRLATYRYHNMDQVVAQALAAYRRMEQPEDARPPAVHSALAGPATSSACAVRNNTESAICAADTPLCRNCALAAPLQNGEASRRAMHSAKGDLHG
jgi:hypothetical protein